MKMKLLLQQQSDSDAGDENSSHNVNNSVNDDSNNDGQTILRDTQKLASFDIILTLIPYSHQSLNMF